MRWWKRPRTPYHHLHGSVPQACSSLAHQTAEHCLFNHMLSDCLVLGSHSCTSTASGCPSRIAGSGFAFTALGTFFAHPGHIVVGTVAVCDSWVRLELTLLCTFDVLWTRLEPSSQLLCTPGLNTTRQLELDQLLCTLSPLLVT